MKIHYSRGKIMTIVFVSFVVVLGIFGLISIRDDFTINESNDAVMIEIVENTTIYTNTKIVYTADRSGRKINNIVVKVNNIVCRLSETVNLDAEGNFYRCNNIDSSSDEFFLYIAKNIEFVAIHDKENNLVYLDKKGLMNSEFGTRLPILLSN